MKKHHDCRIELKNAGLRVTPARLGVLAGLEESRLPLDIKDIIGYLSLKKIKADKVTVFRIINALVHAKLVIPIQLHEGKFRYEHVARSDHHHFVCESCKRIEDIFNCKIDELEKDLYKKNGLLIKHHSLEFFGLCQDCQQ